MENNYAKMTFMKAIRRCLSEKYLDFTGRASRSEYWYFTLGIVVLSLVLQVVLFGLNPQSLEMTAETQPYTIADGVTDVIQLLLFLPCLAVTVRRLHDVGKNGWNVLWSLIPLFGTLYLIYLYCRPSQKGSNEYGPQPPETVVDSVS